MTGAPLPHGADTVVPVEQTEAEGATVSILRAGRRPAPTCARRRGRRARRDVLLERGTGLGPAEIGLLASVGCDRVRGGPPPPRGDPRHRQRARPAGRAGGPGQIRNSNSFTAYGQVLAAGGEPVPLGIARDDRRRDAPPASRAPSRRTSSSPRAASRSASSTSSSRCRTSSASSAASGRGREAGQADGVRRARRRCLVFGVPGNPVAAMVSFELYIRPALLAMQGCARPLSARSCSRRPRSRSCAARGARRRAAAACGARRDAWRFSTTGPQGSGILRSMALADGLAFVPAGFPGGGPGERSW